MSSSSWCKQINKEILQNTTLLVTDIKKNQFDIFISLNVSIMVDAQTAKRVPTTVT